MSLSEFDETRRFTLKVMAGTSASLAAGCLGVVNVADALDVNTEEANSGAHSHPSGFPAVLFDLDMHIISSTGVVENSLTLKNNTRYPMHIACFRSDQIVFGDKYVSLDAITDSGPIQLEPMQTKAFQVDVALLGETIPTDYVHADNCVTAISDECVDVHLGGFLVGSDVMVITRKQNSIDVML